MGYISTPPKQRISIDPYTGKLFDFDSISSRVYLSRTINNLLRVFGTDIILNGLKIKSISYNVDPDIDDTDVDALESFSLKINPGKCIIDTTLIEIEEESSIDNYEISHLNDIGYLLLFLSFRYSESVYENQAKFKLLWLDSTKRLTNPVIDPSIDRILISILEYNKITNTVKEVAESSITIGKLKYDVYPYNNFKKAAELYTKNLFS